MGISVNGFEITDDMVSNELPMHQDVPNPVEAAVQELILRRLMLEEADRRGIKLTEDDDRIEALMAEVIQVPEATDEEAHRFYDQHQEQFKVGELAEADHILFQVTEGVPLELLRAKAESVLDEVQKAPARFAELAKTYSNCPSGEAGGNLGQLQRGETVPEFDKVLWTLEPGTIAPSLIETQFGLHIIRVNRRADGNLMPYEQIAEKLKDFLQQQAWRRALHQFLQILVGKADIQGFEIRGIGGPLVQ